MFLLRSANGNITNSISSLNTTTAAVIGQHGVDSELTKSSVLEREKPNNIDHQVSLNNIKTCEHIKFIVFVCFDRQLCGGWGDRQKGIITTYLLAMLMNRSFSILVDKPCDFSRFLVPNEYNWMSCYQYVRKIQQSKTNYSSIKRFMNCTAFDNCTEERVIFIRTNQIWISRLIAHPKAVQRIPWALNKTIAEVSKIVLEKLFRPSDVLESAIQNFTRQIGDRQKLICSHIRTGKNPTLPKDNSRFSARNISAVFRFLKTYDDIEKYAIFIATDSENIRRLVEFNFTNFLSTKLPIVHVDRITKQQATVACTGLFAVLLEQHILSRCDLLLLTRSNMGAMAAYMSSKSQKLYILYHLNQTIFEVTLNEIQRYFKFV